MATIHQFERSYHVRNTQIKCKALDLACAQLGPAGRSHSVRKVIAQRILKAMEKGERDPARLCTIGLSALGPVIVRSVTRRSSAGNFRQHDAGRLPAF
jgi:hypothetical protein